MGLLNKLINKQTIVEPVIFQNSIKFVDYRFIVLIDISQPKKNVEKIAEDLQSILINTQSSYSKNPKNGLVDYNSLVGCTNAFLEKNLIMTYGKSPQIGFPLSKTFLPFIDKEKKHWKISLVPTKPDGAVDQYSFLSMHNDAPIFAQASSWIKEYMHFDPPTKNGSTASHDIDIVDDEPVIIQKDPPINRAYSVRSRLIAAKKYPELDVEQFNESVKTTLNNILTQINDGIGGAKGKKWSKLVRKILDGNTELT